MVSLQKLCLDIIVQKFERFCFAFTVTNDENLRRSFEFLQRRFSVQIASELALYRERRMKKMSPEYLGDELSREWRLTKEFFKFLINEHLTFLNDRWFKYNSDLFSKDLFCRLPNLTRIRLEDRRRRDEILKSVAKYCPKIVEIDVRGSVVTNEGIRYLYKRKNGKLPCPELKNIFVQPYSRITDRGAEYLISHLPSLEKFDYVNVPLALYSCHDRNLSKCEEIQTCNLMELNFLDLKFLKSEFCRSNYTYFLKTCLSVCPKLESVACYVFRDDDLNLFNNRHLKKVRLGGSVTGCPTDFKINIDNFLKNNGRSLISLELSDVVLSVLVLKVHCPSLKKLYARRVHFTDDDDDDDDMKPTFTSLTECSFADMKPSSQRALRLLLSSSSKVESVSFTFGKLPLEVKDTFHLLACYFKNRRITLETEFLMDILLNCSSLKEVTVFGTEPEGAEMENSLKNLAKSLPNKPKVLFGVGSEFEILLFGEKISYE